MRSVHYWAGGIVAIDVVTPKTLAELEHDFHAEVVRAGIGGTVTNSLDDSRHVVTRRMFVAAAAEIDHRVSDDSCERRSRLSSLAEPS